MKGLVIDCSGEAGKPVEKTVPWTKARVDKAKKEAVRAKKEQYKKQIAELERQITPRRLREAVLGIDDGWLAGLEKQISKLRKGK